MQRTRPLSRDKLAPITEQPSRTWFTSARRKALRWYRAHARDLPWRETHDPYRIWVSEVMLQQTQVETVIPYYHRFLDAFPTVKQLAAAEEREVLKLWEGLGYYRRARQLHRAAQVIVQQHDGTFPQTFDEVLALPGVGRYTAGAILSFAFDQRLPILEGNTLRLHSRLLGYDEDVSRQRGQKVLWAAAEAILSPRNCGETNQALMELGSQVCKVKAPLCSRCPLRTQCAAFAAGNQLELPNTGAPMAYESIDEAAVVVRRGKHVLLRECQQDERWAGLWDFPRFALTATSPARIRRELTDQLQTTLGLSVEIGEQLVQIRHGVTKYRIRLKCFEGTCPAGARARSAGKTQWVTDAQLDDYPLSVTGRKISRLVQQLSA
ncbi:MAG: A/G-specific adenine glycosylase [Planctomycetota bacterium]